MRTREIKFSISFVTLAKARATSGASFKIKPFAEARATSWCLIKIKNLADAGYKRNLIKIKTLAKARATNGASTVALALARVKAEHATRAKAQATVEPRSSCGRLAPVAFCDNFYRIIGR